jgi:hypothetical protein
VRTKSGADLVRRDACRCQWDWRVEREGDPPVLARAVPEGLGVADLASPKNSARSLRQAVSRLKCSVRAWSTIRTIVEHVRIVRQAALDIDFSSSLSQTR